MTKAACPLCGDESAALPALPASMLSDGRVLSEGLWRRSCLGCGAAFAWPPPAPETVAAWFAGDYALPERAAAADARRAQAYADWIGSAVGPVPSTVLDAGCGSGALLTALGARWPDARLTGFDPAIPLDRTSGCVQLLRGGEQRVAGETFDLVVSVNAIEHTPDPRRFLKALAEATKEGGMLVVVCPDGDSVGTELLIADHLHSFSGQALQALAKAIGMATAWHDRRAGFQMLALRCSRAGGVKDTSLDAGALVARRTALLNRWIKLDQALSNRLPETLPAFGAGEAAALLRVYAPTAWARTERLMLDEPADAWPLGRSVGPYQAAPVADAPILLAVSAAVEAGVAARLQADGWAPVGTTGILGAEALP